MTIYIWKALNGLLPSLGLEWKESGTRLEPVVEREKVTRSYVVKNLQRGSLRNFGVTLFNLLLA